MVEFTQESTGEEVVRAYGQEAFGKTILITGPSKQSLGAQTAIELAAAKPKLLILAGRNKDYIQPVIDQIKSSYPEVEATFVKLDLADNSSVREAAATINSQIDKLDILINNAGVMAVKNYTSTKDGIEMHFGANHIGHFLLTNLLMPKILAAGEGARIINITSFGYLADGVRFDDWNFKDGAEYNPWLGYSQSKTANILFTGSLARKLASKGVLVFSATPGLVTGTKLQDKVTQDMFQDGMRITQNSMNGMPFPNMMSKSLEQGSATTIYGALDPSLKNHSGAFLSDCEVYTGPLKDHAKGEDKQERLWALSEKLVNQKFTYT